MPPDHGKLLDERELTALRRLIARLGERKTAKALHISRNSLQRLRAQLPCQRGTIALVRQQLTARTNDDGERTTPVM